jgi:hypothetical protein
MSTSENILFHAYDFNDTSLFREVRFLFNSAKNLRLQPSSHWRIYEVQLLPSQKVKARICFSLERRNASSPERAPFGFIEVYEDVLLKELIKFFQFMEADFVKHGIKKVQVKSYPECYDPNFELIETVFKEVGYSVATEITSILPIDEKRFEKKIKISELQKLKKAAKLFSVQKVKISQLDTIYSFIERCRKERNQHLSMRLSDLEKTKNAFPRNILLFRVHNGNTTAAAAIVIKINKEILYTFYYAHAREFDKLSPVVLLISFIYEWAQERGVKQIDLGTSMLDGKVNRSLLHFKKSIGGQSIRKLIFEKNLT